MWCPAQEIVIALTRIDPRLRILVAPNEARDQPDAQPTIFHRDRLPADRERPTADDRRTPRFELPPSRADERARRGYQPTTRSNRRCHIGASSVFRMMSAISPAHAASSSVRAV